MSWDSNDLIILIDVTNFTGGQADEIARLNRELENAKLENEALQIQMRSFLRRELIAENHDRIAMLQCELENEHEKKQSHQTFAEYEKFEGDAAITSKNFGQWWTDLRNYTRTDAHQKGMREWFGDSDMGLVEETATGIVTDDGDSCDSDRGGSIPSYHGAVRLCYLIIN